jgi:hypothetical protein
MTKSVLLTTSLLAISFLVTAQAAQVSETINSHGTITYSTQSFALKRYASENLLRRMDAATLAYLFDMCQAWSWDSQKIQQVRQIKPNFKALFYRCIKAITYESGEWQTALDSNWILKDETGRLVYDTSYPTHYLVDIGNPQYQKWVANWINESISQYLFDGVMADNSLYSQANEIFWTASTQPINPRTGTFWTDVEVRQALIQIHIEIKNAIGSQILWCNGINEGYHFWRRYNGYIEFLLNSPFDGLGSEFLWFTGYGDWMSESEWINSLDLLVFIQSNFLAQDLNKLYGAACILDLPLPANCSKEKLTTYAFASTMLGIKTNQNYLALYTEDVDFTVNTIQPLFDIEFGAPVNDYYIVANTHVYARDFSNAKILVNPSSDSYVIDLQGTFKTLDDELVSEITIEDHSGIILLRNI